jgi:hypothetical protein
MRMGDEPIQVRQVRWMGVGVGVIVALIGALFCLAAWTIATEAWEKGTAALWLGTAVTLMVGGLAVRYGISLARRARSDDEVATLTMKGLGMRRVEWSKGAPPPAAEGVSPKPKLPS